MKQDSISAPITPAEAAVLPCWYWNVRPPAQEMTPEQIKDVRRAAQKADAKRKSRARVRATVADAIRAGLACDA